MMFDSMPESLDIVELMVLANSECRKCGLRAVKYSELAPMYDQELIAMDEMVPALIRSNEHVTLWIDRWYIAVQVDKGDVEYLYLTRFHIDEERLGYAELAQYRKDACILPEDIAIQFDRAEKNMNAAHRNIWVYDNDAAMAMEVRG